MERDHRTSTLKKTEQELTISRGKVVSLEAEGKAQATRIEELTRYTHVDVVNYFVYVHGLSKFSSIRKLIMKLSFFCELHRKMLIESENYKKAIEKAVSASVRLCVVAPTVNVHVAEKKLKFKAGYVLFILSFNILRYYISFKISYPNRLSEAALKDFLKSEVLDKYSFLYKQKSENTAPNGSNLESWLQKMLAQMQTSIQNHVNSAMDGAEL